MKIVFCDNSLRELINFREDIINHYLSKGSEVIIIAPENFRPEFESSNIKYIPINVERSGMNPLKDLKYFISLYNIYKKEKPDYIFHYTIKPNIYGSFAARLNNIPSTAMIAGLGYIFSAKGLRAKIGRRLYRIAMKFPENILVLNQFNKDLIIQRGIASTSKVILLKGGEGVNLKKFD